MAKVVMVTQEPERYPSLDTMKDGDIAEIKVWKAYQDMVGTLVQRYGEALVPLGKPYGKSWGGLFRGGNNSEIRVRILPPGTAFKLVD